MNKSVKNFIKTVLILAIIFVSLFSIIPSYAAKKEEKSTNTTSTNSTSANKSNSKKRYTVEEYKIMIINNEITFLEMKQMDKEEQEKFLEACREDQELAGKVLDKLKNTEKFKDQIKKEGGSFFEKIIAECIGGIAQAVFDFTSSDFANVGFKKYDRLIFNKYTSDESLSPFTDELWSKTMHWYSVFAIISGILILIAIIILAFKMFSAGVNTARRNDVKDSIFRLLFGALAIALAPLFIRVLIFLNNSLVNMLVNSAQGSLEDVLGENMISNIQTGNPIATALVIALFVYLFVKLNIKFIIRQFTLIIFTIFTPISAGLWVINRNTTAVAIWAGQIFINIFMQFIYCFLFMVYLAFLPKNGGWAISIIWAMMILPLADTLQNCLQNLTSRIAGIDNEQIANRGIGMGAAIGYSLSTLAQQFKTPEVNKLSNNNNNGNGNSNSFLGRIKNVVNPPMNLYPEKDYNGNTNPIRNVIPKDNIENNKISNKNVNETSKINPIINTTKNVIGGAVKAGTTYFKTGAIMAGDGQLFQNHYEIKNKNSPNITEHINNAQMQYKEGETNEKET